MRVLKYIRLLLFFFFVVGWIKTYAQDPSNLPLFPGETQNSVSLSTINSISLDFTSPVEAGEPFQPIVDNSKWLNYNVTIVPPEPTMSITAEIYSGVLLDGLELKIQVGQYVGAGGGSPGTPSGEVVLSNFPQVILDNIGTCNTGLGSNVGHQITYTLDVSDMGQIQSGFSTLNVMFTISQ